MKKVTKVFATVMVIVLAIAAFSACGSKDAISGTWVQKDDINGNWTWTFDGGNCKLVGETTGFQSEGTYVLNEDEGTITVNIELWDQEKVYTYTLSDNTLDLEETYSSYHLVKQ